MSEENNNEKTPFVIITNEWIDKWLSYLNETELKVYMRLAYHYNRKNRIAFPGQQTIRENIGIQSNKPVINALSKLEELGLIETLKKPPGRSRKGWPSNQYRMLHVDDNGYHRVERQQSSLKEAIAEQKAQGEFIADMTYKYNDDNDALPEAFKRFPDFKEAYYSRGWDKEEGIWLFEALSIFLITSFRDKYEDLEPFRNYIDSIAHFQEKWAVWQERLETVKKDMKAQWDRAMEDYVYCCEYVANNYPEYIPVLKESIELKSKRVKGWNEGFKKVVEKHPDIEEITLFFNYGIFKELAEKHSMATREIGRLAGRIGLEDDGMVGLAFDMDGYVNKVYLPDEETLVTEEENRLLELEPEDGVYKDEETGEIVVMSKGFTKAEKRDFKGTLKKIEKAKRKVVDALVEGVARVLAEVYVDGKVRETEGGYRPIKRYWKDAGDGYRTQETEWGYHPANMGLDDLLKHATDAVNDHTNYIRGERDAHEDDPLVSIPPVTLEEVRAKFEAEKERLLAEKREAEKATG
ncbi:hypothetical protein ES702_07306 [subsurface metagenome]